MLQSLLLPINITSAEMEVLEELSARKDLSKTAVLRQALRLYQMVDIRIARGEKLFFEDEKEKKKAEVNGVVSKEAIKIIRRSDDVLVDARLFGDLKPEDLVLIERSWTVKRQDNAF